MSASKQKGTSFESSLLPLLREYYPGAERRAMQGANDKGDFLLPGEDRFILEAKNCARLDLPKWIAEAQAEAVNANTGDAAGVVVHKRHGKTDPAVQWVTMTLADFLWLVNP